MKKEPLYGFAVAVLIALGGWNLKTTHDLSLTVAALVQKVTDMQFAYGRHQKEGG
jgi:hypothetical protein